MTEDQRKLMLYEQFMDATKDGFIVVDTKGIVTDINKNYCEFLGTSKEKAIGHMITDIIPDSLMMEFMKDPTLDFSTDGRQQVHHFNASRNGSENEETFAIANRFCYYNEAGEMIGSAAQVTFRDKIFTEADSFIRKELAFYKGEYQKNNDMELGAFSRILGNDPDLIATKKKALKVARKEFPVLITGESGTGKELFAKAIHMESPRKNKPFVAINCAAIPAELLESELFGYEQGAFTGSKKGGKIGKFQMADKGTLFLDEIGDMSLPLQAKLLRALQEKEIDRVGGSTPISVDIRIIAATRQNLEQMIEDGTFREDLYYRLNVINLQTIPLRQMQSDIVLHAEYALEQLNNQYKTETVFSDSVKRILTHYSWPGNIRELQNVVASAYASCDYQVIDNLDLPGKLLSHCSGPNTDNKRLADLVEEYEVSIIRSALRRNNQNIAKAAADLGIDRSLLYKKIKKAGITIQKVLMD